MEIPRNERGSKSKVVIRDTFQQLLPELVFVLVTRYILYSIISR